MWSVWKDKYITITGQTSVDFKVTVGGEDVFNGRAYALPNTSAITINVMEYVRDMVYNELTTFESGQHGSPNASKYVVLYNINTQNNVWSDYVCCDWSYDDNYSSNWNHPINGHYVSGQTVILSYVLAGGSAQNEIYSYSAITPYCGKYSLLYLNSYGGYDSFLIEGSYKKKDTYNTFETERKFNNTTAQFGNLRYVNEITTEYELHTGWLKDSEAANLAKNLLGSTRVYLQDIDAQKIIPVVITNTDAEYKKFKDEKELISYQIDVKESQVKERR